MLQYWFYWIILVAYNIGLYIYKSSYIRPFFVIFNCNVFSELHAKRFEIWKSISWNWWFDYIIAQSIKWCDISRCFYGVFSFSRKLYFPWFLCLLLIAESISLDTFSKPTVGVFRENYFSLLSNIVNLTWWT